MSCRRKAPLFRGSEGPVHEGLAPVQLTLVVELGDERAPEFEPDLVALPLGKAPPAGRRTRILLRKILPACAGAEDPEDPLEAGAVIGVRAAALGAGLPLRQVGLDQSPLGIRQALHLKL